jgi:hypothetical protein
MSYSGEINHSVKLLGSAATPTNNKLTGAVPA